MPANGRWDLIGRLKVNDLHASSTYFVKQNAIREHILFMNCKILHGAELRMFLAEFVNFDFCSRQPHVLLDR
jgi:hypothetical protein